MNNLYQQQLMEFYINQCGNLYTSQHIYPSQNVNMLEVSEDEGILNVNIIDFETKEPIANATITIYVTDGINRDIPLIYLVTSLNPVKITLPMASKLGTKILGPEYFFSTYNLRVEAFNYFSSNVYNIRLFPNITSTYEVILNPTSQIQPPPVKIEKRITEPLHPRDELIME
jgi:hypothetical protein